MAKRKQAPAAIPAEDLVDVESAAKLVWVKAKTIHNWLSAGKITRYKIGSRTLVRRSQILSLVKEG